jgi:hypothetical protein
MGSNGRYDPGGSALTEMKEFAAFAKGTQRYIRRSLDVGLDRRDAIRRWARDPLETARIRAQRGVYLRLDSVRAALAADHGLPAAEALMGPLLTLTAFDLGEGRLPAFAPYRFLYERLIGARARPWLPAAFSAAATLPHIHPDNRRTLLRSIGEVAVVAQWSTREPVFVPVWIEKADTALTA